MQKQHLTNEDIDTVIAEPALTDIVTQNHLASCTECQQKVDFAIADPWWWNEGRELIQSTLELAEETGPPPAVCSREGYDPIEAEIDELIASFQAPKHPELLGRVGDYDVHALIGVGGMGAVFKGFDQELNRPVAIKFLLPRHSNSGVLRQQFSREAMAIAAVRNDNVIPVFRIDSDARFPHFAMPLIAGVSLEEYVGKEGALKPLQLVQIAMQIATGLDAAHEQGLIHRDVKPANILLENNCNRVVVTDFGLAKIENETGLTQTGMIAGTPMYMSPEQADGRPLDRRSDLFSLGSVMYFMATGREPFSGQNQLELLKNIRQADAPSIQRFHANFPRRLEQMIQRLLARNPAHRFQNASDVRDFLVEYAAHLCAPESNQEPSLKVQLSSHFRIFQCAVVAGLLLIGMLAYSSWKGNTQEVAKSNQDSDQSQLRQDVSADEPLEFSLESSEMDAYFAEASHVPRVHGVLTGYAKEDLKDLVVQYYVQVPSKIQETRLAEIDRNGRFEIKLDYSFPYQQFGLIVGDLFHGTITVHRELTVNVDLEMLRENAGDLNRKGVTFAGVDADMTEYVAAYQFSSIERLMNVYAQKSELSSKRSEPLATSLESLNEIYDHEKQVIEDYISEHPSKHSWILKDSFQSDYCASLMVCHVWRQATIDPELLNECLLHQPRLMNQSSTEYYHNLNLLMSMTNRRQIWEGVIRAANSDPADQKGLDEFLRETARKNSGQSFDSQNFAAGTKKYVTPNINAISQAFLTAHLEELKEISPQKANVVMLIGAQGAISPKEYLQAIVPLMTDGWCKTLLAEEHENALERLAKARGTIERAMTQGTDALGKKMLSTAGMHFFVGNQDSGEEFADALVRAFPDKAIIVDFWSMSCRACLHDMKGSKQIKAELSELPVEIVYVCLDSEYESWLETMVSEGVKGNHLFLNEELSAKVSDHFKISSHPSFVFVDQDGVFDPNLIRFMAELEIETVKSKLKLDENN